MESDFSFDLEFEKSPYVKKYLPGIDRLAFLEIECKCWLDLLQVSDSHFLKKLGTDSKPRTALVKLKEIVTSLKLVQREPVIPGIPVRGRRLVRAASVSGQVEGKFQARKDAVLALIDECLGFLAHRSLVLVEPLQQLVHYYRYCDGCNPDRNIEMASPLYGSRYECELCTLDFCSNCYEQHDHSHVLKMHRVVLADDSATTTDLWQVKAITGHSGKGVGRVYTVQWVGNWAS